MSAHRADETYKRAHHQVGRTGSFQATAGGTIHPVRRRSEQDFVGQSGTIHRLRRLIRRLAPSDVPMLLTGEPGTGKRLLAEVIHGLSPFRQGPFLIANGADRSEIELAVTLFGCEPGVWGAQESCRGLLELAHGGSLLLDHVDAMPRWMQSRLLRFRETGLVERLGGDHGIPVRVRLIATIADGAGRSAPTGPRADALQDALDGSYPLAVPPLREREDDVCLLSELFLARANCEFAKQVCGFTGEALTMLQAHAWPGNVEELRQYIRFSVWRADRLVTVEHLPPHIRGFEPVGHATAHRLARAKTP